MALRWLVILLLIGLASCGPQHPPPPEQDEAERSLLIFYGAYREAEKRSGHPPKDLEAVRPLLEGLENIPRVRAEIAQ